MNDLTLLEFAAQAVDDPKIHETRVWDGRQFWIEQHGEIYVWNPLLFDGDAFRLAHHLGFTIYMGKKTMEDLRREIVIAAARVGASK